MQSDLCDGSPLCFTCLCVLYASVYSSLTFLISSRSMRIYISDASCNDSSGSATCSSNTFANSNW